MDHLKIIATVRGTEAERATLQVAAQQAGLSLSQYLRHKLDLPYKQPQIPKLTPPNLSPQ